MTEHEVVANARIRELLTRYCYGLDRARPDWIAGTFHPDGTDMHGEGRIGTGQQLAEHSTPRKRAALPNVGQHVVTNMSVRVRGDRARCESYYFMVDPHPDGFALGGGRYLDELEQRDGEWRVAYRTVVVDWSRNVEAFAALKRVQAIPAGRLWPEDPGTEFLDDFEW